MANLIDELGAEDKDNYIYLDSEGKALAKHELTIIWNKLPGKVLMLTLSSEYRLFRSTIKFLKTKVVESMEKYSIFSGLKGLEIKNLTCNSHELPQVSS